jgi:hypothetical protein
MIFVNLPVSDLAAATRFYEAIGFSKNPQFSDAKASCMVWSEEIFFMLLTREFYATFTQKPIADAHAASGHLLALAFDGREAVDDVVARAAAAGGRGDIRPPNDMGFMYQRTFEDPDGNIFEPFWMDPAAVAGGG